MASALTLGGVLSADEPTWYVLYQTLLGLHQSAIALFMMAGYLRAGTWERSEVPPLVLGSPSRGTGRLPIRPAPATVSARLKAYSPNLEKGRLSELRSR